MQCERCGNEFESEYGKCKIYCPKCKGELLNLGWEYQ